MCTFYHIRITFSQPEKLVDDFESSRKFEVEEMRIERERGRNGRGRKDGNDLSKVGKKSCVTWLLVWDSKYFRFFRPSFVRSHVLLFSWFQIHSTEWHGCCAWIVKLNLIFYAYAMDQSFEWHFIMRCHSIKFYLFLCTVFFCWLFTFNKQMVFPVHNNQILTFGVCVCVFVLLLFSLWNLWQHYTTVAPQNFYAQPFFR